MSFKISARTILQLGAELISSDAVALYELIKNAIDAKSKNGVEVHFSVVIPMADYASVIDRCKSSDESKLPDLKKSFLDAIAPTAPDKEVTVFREAVKSAKSVSELLKNAASAYRDVNTIVVSDTGEGMSSKDLEEIYLTIGTTSRAKAVAKAVRDAEESSPYLGEKGVGRLSVMRLGWRVRIETAKASDTHVNILDIDWRKFEEAYDLPAESVKIAPSVGAPKKPGDSFTRIIISDIRGSWSIKAVQQVVTGQLVRMLDPFSWEGRRLQIRLSFNDIPIESVRTIHADLLAQAHAKCKGGLAFGEDGLPRLNLTMESRLYNGALTTYNFDNTDLYSMSGLKADGLPGSILASLGPFDFELYWFNRQRLAAMPGVGDRNVVRDLVKAWAGVCLYRNGYRVLPYGDQGDDWLVLDHDAFGSSGYKLNTKQIIGRVRIGRTKNPRLLDQTNRQGLVETPEKNALVALMHSVISKWWRNYLNDTSAAMRATATAVFDSGNEVAAVKTLEQRAATSISAVGRQFHGDGRLLQEIKDAFLEIKDAHAKAVERIGVVEDQKERLTQLAGIGLMTEVVAHELTRAAEDTLKTLKDVPVKSLDQATRSALKILSQQVAIIKKRLQTLEPLSVPARQRRSTSDIVPIVQYVLDGHAAQFSRHEVDLVFEPPEVGVPAFQVEGHVVQILENLINNSIYWLDVWREEHPHLPRVITVEILASPPRIRYSDTGPGIPASRAEVVFEPFFSTKTEDGVRRKGLGLYIAQQTAELLGGTLALVDEGSHREGRFNIFELTLMEKEHKE